MDTSSENHPHHHGNWGGGSGTNIRNELEEKKQLELMNFDLKMKIFHLEEKMKSLNNVTVDEFDINSNVDDSLNSTMMNDQLYPARNRHDDALNTSNISQHVNTLKVHLSERDKELEQRNSLLIKAKNAIEHLKVELEKYKDAEEQQREWQGRLNTLRQNYESMDVEYRRQIDDLQASLMSTKQLLATKDSMFQSSEERAVSFFLNSFLFETAVYNYLKNKYCFCNCLDF